MHGRFLCSISFQVFIMDMHHPPSSKSFITINCSIITRNLGQDINQIIAPQDRHYMNDTRIREIRRGNVICCVGVNQSGGEHDDDDDDGRDHHEVLTCYRVWGTWFLRADVKSQRFHSQSELLT